MTTSNTLANDRDDAVARAHALDPVQTQQASVLESTHLSRRVGQLTLVQDISIAVAAGEILAIVGPSGA